MDDVAQARAYAAADFAVPHQRFADELVERFDDLPRRSDLRVVDLGCGSADVTVRVALAVPGARVLGVDGSAAMLAEGRRRVASAELADRIELRERLLPDPALADEPFDAVVSNSLLHHLADPAVLWDAIHQLAAPGAAVFVMDLRRPETAAEVDALVERYAAGEAELLVRDFHASLHAAYEVGEVQAQLEARGLTWLEVEALGDRHLVVTGRPPGP
jgi:ubiquinone/menaquinone biosynthesis C-methylase UbiE